MKLELTKEEGNVLISLLDVAVKTAGLQAAEAALFFVKKIEAAAQADKPAEPAAPSKPQGE